MGVLGGESPPLGVLARTRKLSLGQHREVLSEGDVEASHTLEQYIRRITKKAKTKLGTQNTEGKRKRPGVLYSGPDS